MGCCSCWREELQEKAAKAEEAAAKAREEARVATEQAEEALSRLFALENIVHSLVADKRSRFSDDQHSPRPTDA